MGIELKFLVWAIVLGLVQLLLADALVTIERDRERARREEMKERGTALGHDSVDLWAAGLDLVWGVLRG